MVVIIIVVLVGMFRLFIILIMPAVLGLSLLKIIVRWPLFDNDVLLLKVSDFGEVREEIGPHNMVLVNVGALNLAHGDEVIG